MVAIVVGNAIYFSLESYLPPVAQHHTFRPDLGTLIDLWVCVVVFGLVEFVSRRIKRKPRS